MRTTLDLADDALIAAQQFAVREGVSLGEAVSKLIRAGADAVSLPKAVDLPLRGRFALLPLRDEIVTAEYVRELLAHSGP